ncbi:MAG: response regulator, partial [Devosia sp.]|nr:response regulator [Devosia sp.]
MRILLVEDEVGMAKALTAALARHDIVVDHVGTLAMAEEATLSGVHAAVLLDRKLPDGDGLSIIPALRRSQAGLPVIVLSALGSADQRVAGLDTGADDYLAKPFSVDELLARLRAVMRRPALVDDQMVNVGKLRFNL